MMVYYTGNIMNTIFVHDAHMYIYMKFVEKCAFSFKI